MTHPEYSWWLIRDLVICIFRIGGRKTYKIIGIPLIRQRTYH